MIKEPHGSSILAMNKRRAVLWILIVLLAAWNLLQISAAVSSGRMPLYDFIEYWSAARVLLSGGNPYSSDELLGVQRALGWQAPHPLMMWNPPWTFVFILPFAVMPYWTARGIFLLVQVALLIGAADWIWRRSGGPDGRRWIAWAAGLVFLPCAMALYLGQITPVVLAGLTGFLWAIQRRHYIAAGSMILPISVKPHLIYLFWLFFLLWICREGRWRALAGLLITLAAALYTTLLLNPLLLPQYFHALLSSQGPLVWRTPSLGTALMILISPGNTWIRLAPTLVGILCALCLCRRWWRAFTWDRHLNSVLLLSTVTSSFCWIFDWLVLLPVVVIMLVWAQDRPAKNWWLPAGLLVSQLLIILLRQLPGSYNDISAFWFPPLVWLLYWLGFRQQRSN